MNPGKRFEQNFKESVPKGVFCYRLRDGTANFSGGGNENVRFQQTNICDFILFGDSQKYRTNLLYLLELKSTNQKSLPLTSIRDSQLEGLKTHSEMPYVEPGFVVNFRVLDETYFLGVEKLVRFKEQHDRRSIPHAYIAENGVYIPEKKKKVNSSYDLSVLF